MQRLRTLHLFAGAGGGVLADLLLGHQPVCAVEINEYCQQVLAARQEEGSLPWFPIFADVTKFNGKPWRGTVDIVAGGFPCQDISAAGKGAGITGERSGLWMEMARIIGEVRPRYAFVENSPVLTVRGLGVVLGDLASLGFDARWGVLGAADVGAPHLRERIWIVANDPQHGRRTGRAMANAGCGRRGREDQGQNEQQGRAEAICASEDVADAARIQPGRTQQRPERERTRESGQPCQVSDTQDAQQNRRWNWPRWWSWSAVNDGREDAERTDWWISEPDVGRVVDGLAARVERLRAIGNGQVPQCAAVAFELLSS